MILCWLISQDLGQVQFELNSGRLHRSAGVWPSAASNTARTIMTRASCWKTSTSKKIWQTPTGFRRNALFTYANNSPRLVVFADDGGPNGFHQHHCGGERFRQRCALENHHADTERSLRPILRELHQESAFAADPASAWQVLSSEWPVDEKLRTSVSEMIPGLIYTSATVYRLHGQPSLQKLGRDAALMMM